MPVKPETDRPLDRVRVGLIGLGTVAQACHLPLLDRLAERFELTAVADLSPTLRAELGARHRVPPERRFPTGEELLEAGGLDAVLVLTPGSHGSICAAAIERGLPVFVEKPLAYTTAEIDELAAALERRAGRLELGYMKLYDPAVARVREAASRRREGGVSLRSIEITVLHPPGEPQLAHAHLVHASDAPPEPLRALAGETSRLRAEALGEAPEWLARLYTDVLLGSVVHELALVRDFAGDPVAIDRAGAWSSGTWPPSVELDGRLAGGARLSIRWHYLPGYPAYREIVRLVWEDGSAELEFPAPYLLNAPTSIRLVERDGASRRDTEFTSYVEAFEEELVAFHRLVVDGTPPAAGTTEARADTVTCQRVARRLADGLGLPIGGEAAALPLADVNADATAPLDAVRAQLSWTTRPS
ncbi:MAG TPA: Gfo/Idh/MocA family oxidoreductase [Candidatus Limnocylindrales bacterium]|nr:Gfo/Idh/MocA family oxidoreductase [Candidatus Limnocylindrales bacterium]